MSSVCVRSSAVVRAARARPLVAILVVAFLYGGACRRAPAPAPPRASGYVEATEVNVASKVPGRVQQVNVAEGERVTADQGLVTIDPTDIDLKLRQARAERDQTSAQLRLLEAGSRPEDIRHAEAEVAVAQSERAAAVSELTAAKADEARYEQLLRARAGAQKPRDDAAARREQAEARVAAANDKVRAATATLEKLKAGARVEEVAAGRARVAAADAQIAALEQNLRDATIAAPSGGIVSSRLVEPGELVAIGAPLLVIVDLDHAWANGYVEEPLVPSLTIGQAATVVTDAGDRLAGHVTFISPRAEFTPRNVQTSDERAKLVYRVKVVVDNRAGVLKPGMPVEIQFAGGGGRQ
jgi:membrane fusion protein YbhG